MNSDELRTWRAAERQRLIGERERLDPATLEHFRRRIDTHLERAFPGLAAAKVAFCWPVRGEYDARPLALRLRERGAVTALPVVVASGQPLVFREWHPGVPLASGPLGIPYPASSGPVVPSVALLPLNGWDQAGYRLGYGAGFFDRTLASMTKRPIAIGVGYELGRMQTIRPQAWDIPMDWIVTERGVYRRDPGGLVFLGDATPGPPGALASPVCYADEIAPGDFGDPEA
jgi:5-formyltetrahydrofolate cyclo-ligase